MEEILEYLQAYEIFIVFNCVASILNLFLTFVFILPKYINNDNKNKKNNKKDGN